MTKKWLMQASLAVIMMAFGGHTVMHAAQIGKVATPETQQASISQQAMDQDRNAQLLEAAEKGNLNKIGYLLKRGASINWQDSIKRNAIMNATKNGHLEVIAFLIKKGADINWKYNYPGYDERLSPLMLAASQGDRNTTEFLVLTAGAQVNMFDPLQRTALMMAIKGRHAGIVKFLLQNGAGPNLQDLQGNTALMLAAEIGDTQIAKLIIESGANVNKVNNAGKTARIIAQEKGYKNIVKLLPTQADDEEKKEAYQANDSINGLTPIANKIAQLKITSDNQIDALVQHYKKGISIKGVSGITKINITKDGLEHVFGINTRSNKSGLNQLTGFHHDEDYSLRHNTDNAPAYSSSRKASNDVTEMFIALKKTDIPVHKTIFDSRLTKKQVLDLLVSSLHNIQEYEEQANRLRIVSITPKSVRIETIVDKKTGNMITFYPLPVTPKEEIDAELKDLRRKFKKHFRNDDNKPLRQPLTDQDITNLLTQFPHDIPINLNIVPYDRWSDVLVADKQLPALLKKHAPGSIVVKGTLKTLHFTPEGLKKALSLDPAPFPMYLSWADILQHVIEIVQDVKNGANINGERDDYPQLKKMNGFTYIHGQTKGNDPFVYYVGFNADTGVIENFYPLFY